MDFEKLYTHYQKYIAIAERMRLNQIPTREPVMAGSVDLPLSPEPAHPEREMWRPTDVQEAVARIAQARN